MRTEGQIRHKLKQVIYRHLQRRLRDNFKPTHENCYYNGQAYREHGEAEPFRVCLYGLLQGGQTPGDWKGPNCDARLNPDTPKNCPYFKPRFTKEEVKAAFVESLRRPPHEVAADYPDVVALLWCLGEGEEIPAPEAGEGDDAGEGTGDEPEPEPETEEVETGPPEGSLPRLFSLAWWRKLGRSG